MAATHRSRLCLLLVYGCCHAACSTCRNGASRVCLPVAAYTSTVIGVCVTTSSCEIGGLAYGIAGQVTQVVVVMQVNQGRPNLAPATDWWGCKTQQRPCTHSQALRCTFNSFAAGTLHEMALNHVLVLLHSSLAAAIMQASHACQHAVMYRPFAAAKLHMQSLTNSVSTICYT